MIVGYARVSKDTQEIETQRNLLKEHGAEVIFAEHVTGSKWHRVELQKMLESLKKGDVVLVYKLDRLSRSLKDLLSIVEIIENKGAHFKCVTQSIDTTTATGKLIMQILGSVAEFERSLISERTKAGLQTARARGRVGGNKYKLTDAQKQEVISMAKVHNQNYIAKYFNVCPATITRVLQKAINNRKTSALTPALTLKEQSTI